MVAKGGLVPDDIGTLMGGDAVAAVQNFDGGGSDFNIDGLADEETGDTIVVVFDVDMVVEIHALFAPLGEFIGLGGEGLGGGAIEFLEDLVSGFVEFSQEAVVKFFQEDGDGGIEFGKGIEDAVAQDREDPALGDEDTIFDFGFVPRFVRSGR